MVTDDGGWCKGIFAERDAIKIVAGNISQDTPMEEVMTKNPIMVKEGAPFVEAMDLMVTQKIRHMLVVNDDKPLVGLLSIWNFLDVVGFTHTKV